MFGLRLGEFILIVGMFSLVTAFVIGTIYIAVRLALRHERRKLQ